MLQQAVDLFINHGGDIVIKFAFRTIVQREFTGGFTDDAAVTGVLPEDGDNAAAHDGDGAGNAFKVPDLVVEVILLRVTAGVEAMFAGIGVTGLAAAFSFGLAFWHTPVPFDKVPWRELHYRTSVLILSRGVWHQNVVSQTNE